MGESDQVVVDGITVDLVDPALCIPIPTSSDVLHRPDSVAAAATVRPLCLPPSGELLTAVQSLLPGRLSGAGLIDALEACDRLRALVDAKQAELLAKLARRDPHGEKFLRDEAALALKLAPATAHDRLDVAEALTGRLWDTFELLRDGHLSSVHARILADATDDLPDEVVAKVQAQVLRRAPGQTPGEFRAAVRRAVAKYDAKSQSEKHRDAATQRHVRKEHVEDGMGWINLFGPADGIETVWTAVTAWSTKTSRQDQRTADQRRADALVDICAAALALPGVPTEHGLKPAVNVTLAATTLAGLDDQPGYLNGEPSPPTSPAGSPPSPAPTATTGSSMPPADSWTRPRHCPRTPGSRPTPGGCSTRPARRHPACPRNR